MVSGMKYPSLTAEDANEMVVRAYDMKGLFGTRRGVVVIDPKGYINYRRVVVPVFRPSDDEVIQAIRGVTKLD